MLQNRSKSPTKDPKNCETQQNQSLVKKGCATAPATAFICNAEIFDSAGSPGIPSETARAGGYFICELLTSCCDSRHNMHRSFSLISPHHPRRKVLMIGNTSSSELHIALAQRCKKVHIGKSIVLFRRGEKASGIFVVLSGKVSLDFEVDSPLARSYGSGALLGLPATVTRHNYSMTATVTEDAELGFLAPEELDALLHERPELCYQLLAILGERVIENNEMQKTLLNGDKPSSLKSVVV
jgi:CRP-like cAMP-binding protein